MTQPAPASVPPALNPTAAAEWVSPADLKPWVRNPRKNDEAVEPIMASIREFGFGAPIVARQATREIIAGHTRWRAACQLGLERVPVRFLDITEEQAHRLALADNKLGEISKWDITELSNIFSDLAAASADAVKGLGFSKEELDKLINVERTSFLDKFDSPSNGATDPNDPGAGGDNTPDASGGTTRTPEGYLTFALKLDPEQDKKLQDAIRAAKKKFGVRTNLDAVLAMCDTILGG